MALISEFTALYRDISKLLGRAVGGSASAALRGGLLNGLRDNLLRAAVGAGAERLLLMPFVRIRSGGSSAPRGAEPIRGAADNISRAASFGAASAASGSTSQAAAVGAASAADVPRAASVGHNRSSFYIGDATPARFGYRGMVPGAYRAARTEPLYTAARRGSAFIETAGGETANGAAAVSAYAIPTARAPLGKAYPRAGTDTAASASVDRSGSLVGYLNSIGILPRVDDNGRVISPRVAWQPRAAREGYAVPALTAREITRLTSEREHASELRRSARSDSGLNARSEVRVDMSGMRNILNDKRDIDDLIDKLTRTISEAAFTAAEGVHL